MAGTPRRLQALDPATSIPSLPHCHAVARTRSVHLFVSFSVRQLFTSSSTVLCIEVASHSPYALALTLTLLYWSLLRCSNISCRHIRESCHPNHPGLPDAPPLTHVMDRANGPTHAHVSRSLRTIPTVTVPLLVADAPPKPDRPQALIPLYPIKYLYLYIPSHTPHPPRLR